MTLRAPDPNHGVHRPWATDPKHAPYPARSGIDVQVDDAAAWRLIQPELIDLCADLRVRSIMDVGCGDAAFVRWAFQEVGFERVIGHDPATVDHVHGRETEDGRHLWLGARPPHDLGAQRVDLLTAFDVAQHLAPGQVERCLREWARVAVKAIVVTVETLPAVDSVALTPAPSPPIVMSADHWHSLLAYATGMHVLQTRIPTPQGQRPRWAFWCTRPEENWP